MFSREQETNGGICGSLFVMSHGPLPGSFCSHRTHHQLSRAATADCGVRTPVTACQSHGTDVDWPRDGQCRTDHYERRRAAVLANRDRLGAGRCRELHKPYLCYSSGLCYVCVTHRVPVRCGAAAARPNRLAGRPHSTYSSG